MKLPQVGLELAWLLTTRHKFVPFDVTSPVDMTVLDHLCVRLASSVRRALEWKSEGCGFDSRVRLTLYLKSRNFSTTLNIIYIYVCSCHKAIVVITGRAHCFHELPQSHCADNQEGTLFS